MQNAILAIGSLLFVILSLLVPAYSYRRIPLWAYTFCIGVMPGLMAGLASPIAILAPIMLGIGLLSYLKSPVRAGNILGWLFTVISAFALGSHAVPGFSPLPLVSDLHLGTDKPPYSIGFSLDKAMVGVLLFRCLFTSIEWKTLYRRLPLILGGIALIYAVAWPLILELNIKAGWYLLLFAVINLFVTCFAEQTFFRGLFQEVLARQFAGKWPSIVIVVLMGALFAAVHGAAFASLPIGITYLTAGIVYAAAYQITRRVEVSILIHFLTNLIHILFFNYPL